MEPSLLQFLFVLVAQLTLEFCINLAFQSVLTLLPIFYGIAMMTVLTATWVLRSL